MECKLVRPQVMEEALAEREKYAEDGLPIAGGQSLLVMLRNRLISPKALIDLERIKELQGISRGPDGFSVGAMATFYSLLSSPEIKEALPVLAQAAGKVSSTAIRNLGTIGGNVCHNELGADLPPALLTLNGEVELRSRSNMRKLPLVDFFRGFFETAIEPNEILCRLNIPKLPLRARGVYLKHAISPEDMAMLGVAVMVIPNGNKEKGVEEVRIALGGVAAIPFRAKKAEAALKNSVINGQALREAGELAAAEAEPMTDPHATADYRRKMIKVFVRRAIGAALDQVEGR
jgi:aerobic carbon-monoxide dehydrogenase medium subunit